MIVIKSIGGLGNQMFQFALYLKLKHLGKSVAFDDSGYEANKIAKYELQKFNVNYDRPRLIDVIKYKEPYCKLFSSKNFKVYDEKLDKGYQPEIYDISEGCLRGYWQCEKYFIDIEDDIKKVFQFDAELSSECHIFLDKICSCNSTAVHIRRGDYLLPQNAKNYSGICTEEYYRNAMSYIKNKHPDTKFFFFSDDIPWVKENLCSEGDEAVDCNHGENSYLDMYLMSKCKNNIIANSSFSWWGAWLNDNSLKTVVAPNRWFRHLEVSDAICDSWVRIS